MTVTLYQNFSDNNVFSKQLEPIATYTNAVARDSVDVVNPIITIATASIGNTNYIRIEENNRCYFVKNIDKVRNGFFALHCHVDVLMSFAESILMNHAIVKRANGLWDSYLPDSNAKEKQFTRRMCYLLKNGNNTLEFSYANTAKTVLITAG